MSTATMVNMETLAKECAAAAKILASTDSQTKNQVLMSVAQGLRTEIATLLAANEKDVTAAKASGLSTAMLDRLILNEARLNAIADAVSAVVELPDPVGAVVSEWQQPNGLEVSRVRVPLGVIAMIYESRPNVTIDAAVLCFKAGNGVILRGGSEAFHTNLAFAQVLTKAFEDNDLPGAAVTLVPTKDRAAINELLKLDEQIDLVIPRGGEGLIRHVVANSRIPVLKHYKGVCHLYVDEQCDQEMALKILIDGKTSRPGVCNALESLLIAEEQAETFLPKAIEVLQMKGVALKVCPQIKEIYPELSLATHEDFAAEFLELKLSIALVKDVCAAAEHIGAYGSKHTEVIVTDHEKNANYFLNHVDASVVMVNASSRFSDGGELGLGAEIGISTSKMHAYGPMGLEALTAVRFNVKGKGQVRHPLG